MPAVILLGVMVCAGAADAPGEAAEIRAADFVLRTLGGGNVRLSEFLGQVVLINFWASWAGPSPQEMPALERLHGTYRSAGLVLLGINVDDNRERAAEFARALKITYPVLFDSAKTVAPAYGLNRVPTTVLIDRAGVVRFVHTNYKPGLEKQYIAQLRRLLDE